MFECEEWEYGAWDRGVQSVRVRKQTERGCEAYFSHWQFEDEIGSQIQAVIWRKLVQCPCGVYKDGIDVVPSMSCKNDPGEDCFS